MPHVEIWASKPRWHIATIEERNRILKQLTGLVRAHAEDTRTCGPFLYCGDRGCSLIWDVRAEHAQALKVQYKFLEPYFEPVMFGSAEGLTALDYRDRIAGGE
jgi:hypothetical protein